MATIPSRKATFTEEEKRKLVEGTDAQGKPLSESEKMKLSKMHTARTLGADWRERGAERMKAEESARAQQALAERAAINRRLAPRDYKLPTKADEFQDIPGGGKVRIGAETIKRMQGFEKERASQEQARKKEMQTSIAAAQQKAGAALKQRYEEELASRGFAPPKTRQEQEAIDRAKMEEFQEIGRSKLAAREEEKRAVGRYKDYINAAKIARSGKDYAAAALYDTLAKQEEIGSGGNIKNASLRKRFFENQELQKAKERIAKVTEARKSAMQKQTTSTPEASSFTPTATAAPLAGAADTLSYGFPLATPAGPTEQPFGMTTPAMTDYGVDFSSISPYNVSGFALPRIAKSPASQAASPQLTAKQKDELISERIRSGAKSLGRTAYKGAKAAVKAILEGAGSIER